MNPTKQTGKRTFIVHSFQLCPQSKFVHLKKLVMGSSADRVWTCIKKAFLFPHFGQSAAVDRGEVHKSKEQKVVKVTFTFCAIHIFPSFFSPKNVINFFSFELYLARNLAVDVVHIGAGLAKKPVPSIRNGSDLKHIGAGRTELHDDTKRFENAEENF